MDTNQHFIIIGGMGPQASLALHAHLLGTHEYPDDYPMITHFSLPIPDFITHPGQIARALRIINQATLHAPLKQAVAIGLVCNTAHLFANQIEACRGENFVSMIDAVVHTIKQQNYKTIGLLASPMTVQKRLYHDPLEQTGVKVLTPTEDDLLSLAAAIRHVLRGDTPRTKRDSINVIAKKLEAAGAECIVLGCTELPLIGIDSALPVIDSLSCLGNGMLQHRSEVY